MAEEVEVVRVEVVVIAKAIAWLARARPAVLDSSQAAFVERDRPSRLVTLTNGPLVPADKDDEGSDREDEQPTAQHLLPCGYRHEDAQPKYSQTGVAELSVALSKPLLGGGTQCTV